MTTCTIAFDSGCDMKHFPSAPAAALHLVPMKILLGDEEVIDGGAVPLSGLQQKLDNYRCKTGTACPSVGDWRHVMEESDQVLALTISGAVSGSHQSAVIARRLVLEEHPEKQIFVVDSTSGSGVMQFMVRRALALCREGRPLRDIARELEESRDRYSIYFLLQNVDNLMSNGRLNPIVGRAVKALHLGLLSTVSPEGTMKVVSKVRTFGKAMDRAVEECLAREGQPRHILITHNLNPQGAETLKHKLLIHYPQTEVEVQETNLLCGYYAEKGGLLLALDYGA